LLKYSRTYDTIVVATPSDRIERDLALYTSRLLYIPREDRILLFYTYRNLSMR